MALAVTPVVGPWLRSLPIAQTFSIINFTVPITTDHDYTIVVDKSRPCSLASLFTYTQESAGTERAQGVSLTQYSGFT